MPNAKRKPLLDVCLRVPLRTPSDRLDRGEKLTPAEKKLDQKYRLLVLTVDNVIKYEGRFNQALATGDVVTNLRDAAIAGSVSHLRRRDLVEHATSVTRHLIYEAKRKISHPRKLRDEYGRDTGDWTVPVIPCDVSGARLVGPKGLNASESFFCEHLEREWHLLSLIEDIGATDYRWALDYVERKGDGTLTNKDHQRFSGIKQKVRKKIPSGFTCE